MVEQNRRFIIVQDDNADKPFDLSNQDPVELEARNRKEASPIETEDLQNDDQNFLYNEVKEGFYCETADFSEVKFRPDSGQPKVGISSIVTRPLEDDAPVSKLNYRGRKRTLGDMSVSRDRKPDQTYTANPDKKMALDSGVVDYPKFVPETMKTQLISGEGIVSSSGSSNKSRFVFRRDGDEQFQFRATPNYFGKTTDVLAFHQSDVQGPTEPEPGKGKSFAERVYNRPGLLPLKNGNLLAYYSNQGSPPWTWGWATGIQLAGDSGVVMPQGPGIRNDGGGSDGGEDGLIRVHLLDKKTMLWSESPKYDGTFTDYVQGNVSDSSYANDDDRGITGLSFTQFQDTEEVICVYAGYFGSVSQGTASEFKPNQYLKVDVINNGFRSASEVYAGTLDQSIVASDTGNPKTLDAVVRGDIRFGNKYNSTLETENPSDVAGMELANPEFILDITAQAMPSGRLVVVMATSRQLLSLVSDDRGATFRSSKILDLTFSEDPSSWNSSAYMQRMVSVDSTITDSGMLAIVVACNGINERAINSDTATVSRQQSVISVFLSGDGEMWGREKALGGGTSTDKFVAGNGQMASNNTNNLDESIYPLDASICCTVEGYIHVSVIGSKAGAPSGTHSQWIWTRTFSSLDIANNAYGQEIARSIPNTLQGSESPWDTRTHRLVPAQCNLAAFNQIGYGIQYATDQDGGSILLYQYLRKLNGGLALPTGAGYVFNGEGSSIATSAASNWPGGGPVRCNGPFGISTVRWRGQIVTILSNYFSDKVLDFPDSRVYLGTEFSSGWPDPFANRTRSISILRSNHFQPAFVKIPTQGCVWAPNLRNIGDPVQRGRFNIDSYQSKAKYGNTFGSNSYSLSWNTAWNPESTGWHKWQSTGSSVTQEVGFADQSDLARKCNGGSWRIYTNGFGSRVAYSYPDNFALLEYQYSQDLASWSNKAFQNSFPNADGAGLKVFGQDFGAEETMMQGTIRGAMGFVCRAVVCPVQNDWIQPFDQNNPEHINPQTGIRVCLNDGPPGYGTGPGKRRQVVLSVDCLRQFSGDKCEFVLYTSRNNGQTVERLDDSYVVVDDFDTQQNNSAGNNNEGRATWLEVLFGLRYEKGEEELGIVRPFLYVRRWDRINDPDFMGDFEYNSALDTYITPYQTDNDGLLPPLWNLQYDDNFPMREGIRFGHLRSEFNSTQPQRTSLWKSVQFSRTYLRYESTGVSVWEGPVQDVKFGDTDFQETLHMNPEPPMGMFQENSSGVVCPMAPARTSTIPTFLDRNIHAVFSGRASTNKVFNYRGKSRFPVSNLMSEPSYYGWRGSMDKVSTVVESGATTKMLTFDYTPTSVITLDFGQFGVKPQAIAAFGVNSPAVMFQLSNNLEYSQNPFDPVNDGAKHIATSPLYDPYHKYDRFVQQNVADTPNTCWMWSPRYLFYCQMNNPADGSETVKSQGDLMYRFYDDRISFYPYINQTPSSFSPATTVPFRPHQFRSEGTEEYFVCLYDARMPSIFPQSGSGTIANRISAGEGGQYRHVFKIKDNTATELILEPKSDGNTVASGFGEIAFNEGMPNDPQFNGSSPAGSKIMVGAVAIYSNRFTFNLPQDSYQEPVRFAGSVSPGAIPEKYRYLRIRLDGAKFHNGIETHTIGSIIAGNVIDLSNRDFEWGYRMGMSSGNILTTSKTGGRRSRFMHSPRKSFSVSYNPRASEPRITEEMNFISGAGSGVMMKVDNPQRGFGNSGQPPSNSTNEQMNDYMLSFLSKLSWQEIVDRVRRLGIKGEVFALGFRGQNMVYSKSYLRQITTEEYNLFQHPVLSDPMFMIPARIVSFGGATHITYTGMETLATNDGHPFPCLQVGPIEFSEEI